MDVWPSYRLRRGRPRLCAAVSSVSKGSAGSVRKGQRSTRAQTGCGRNASRAMRSTPCRSKDGMPKKIEVRMRRKSEYRSIPSRSHHTTSHTTHTPGNPVPSRSSILIPPNPTLENQIRIHKLVNMCIVPTAGEFVHAYVTHRTPTRSCFECVSH